MLIANGISIIQASTAEHIAQARLLFTEYANSLDFSLCFQNFEQELRGLPGAYAPPSGRLLLAYDSGAAAGSVALRRLEAEVCEMKRLYLRPAFRGKGLAGLLVRRLMQEAQTIGYSRMRLDTVQSSMADAIRLYRKFGFREIPPYCSNPMKGTLYMELDLRALPVDQ